MIETLSDVVEQIADWCNVYGVHDDNEKKPCRCCFTSDLTERINRAVSVDEKLNRREHIKEPPKASGNSGLPGSEASAQICQHCRGVAGHIHCPYCKGKGFLNRMANSR